ncbi:putative splicing factor [Syncephalis pseudoplumigaleata]|uniref:Branchpoint-bridging protein n=1 Tax=Syncephalis pseudoplumigaleata TaxID=1712513 RepID=A0A4P9Z389_9FUNG|nr:putative splicing factor [Syncephalis pseudoplumigaleata]|eukprot:RKP25970.1 putative splicing factor [Syncephalis pseudoplumigaleata]
MVAEDDGRGRKRKSRWATAEEKTAMPGMPTALAGAVPKEKLDLFLTYVRLEEIGRKLSSGDYVPREKRSPSPEPLYGTDGKRINTREYRYRKKLEDERHKLVQQAQKMDPQFVPPVDYHRPRKAVEKLYIPVRDYPDINFIGLIIGPRGNTLKKMEADSRAKISIRGKGSVKEGKVPTASDGLEEDLHCLVTADSPEKVAKAIKLIEKIIETAVSIPEAQNDLKRAQLRELASLNGTLRDDENQPCLNCGQLGHRRYECPEQRNFTANLVCRICGGAGHAARDCRDRNNPDAQQKNQKLDAEYYNLMAELGEQVDGAAGGGGGGANNNMVSNIFTG